MMLHATVTLLPPPRYVALLDVFGNADELWLYAPPPNLRAASDVFYEFCLLDPPHFTLKLVVYGGPVDTHTLLFTTTGTRSRRFIGGPMTLAGIPACLTGLTDFELSYFTLTLMTLIVEISATDFDDTLELSLPDLLRLLLVAHANLIAARTKEGINPQPRLQPGSSIRLESIRFS
jgi:hypothetical protein